VPAEVSKRGVMIGFFEGALSSRRKRAATIIEERRNKSRKKFEKGGAAIGEEAGCFLIQQKRGKMMISCV
jgi:hypothetical protein